MKTHCVHVDFGNVLYLEYYFIKLNLSFLHVNRMFILCFFYCLELVFGYKLLFVLSLDQSILQDLIITCYVCSQV